MHRSPRKAHPDKLPGSPIHNAAVAVKTKLNQQNKRLRPVVFALNVALQRLALSQHPPRMPEETTNSRTASNHIRFVLPAYYVSLYSYKVPSCWQFAPELIVLHAHVTMKRLDWVIIFWQVNNVPEKLTLSKWATWQLTLEMSDRL